MNKVVVITGGGSGLGKEACLLFSSKGYSVVVADFNETVAQNVSEEITANGGIALSVKVNVSDSDSVNQMAEKVFEKFNKVDVLINNAGITSDSRLVNMTEESWDNVIDINLKGVFLCTKAFAPSMLANGFGRIISTSSISAGGNFGQTNYAASKAGVIAMTKTWAKEFGKYGVTANAVSPGFIESPMTAVMRKDILDNLAKQVPTQRLGKPADIANAYLYLASQEASYVNGHTLEVNGGLTL